jgi:hypothetical protein
MVQRESSRGKHSSDDCAGAWRSRRTGRGGGSLARQRRNSSIHARYRKELTGVLDDAQLRTLEERLSYLRQLEARRIAVLGSIREQGKLDAALEAAILAAGTKAAWKTSTLRMPEWEAQCDRAGGLRRIDA